MLTADGVTFHGQTLFYLWGNIGGGIAHLEVCHFPTTDIEHRIWSICPRTGAKVSYGTVDDHYSSLETAARTVIQLLEGRKRSLDVEIEKWKSVASPTPTHKQYFCNHVKPHVGILSMDPYEVAWRRFLDDMGWLRHGYCYLYYPRHVRTEWARYDAPTYAEGI